MRLVKVLWQHQGVEEATWERGDTICTNYPFLFENKGNFRDKILLRGEECKTRVNLIFLF